MRLSVALCTYNGARFLREQLDSISAQTRRPDEVVVCDDRSTDDTVDILAAFARTAPFPVRLTVNRENLGSSRNFARAITLCDGDVIALADQDDRWFSQKLERIALEFERSSPGLVFSNGHLMDADGHPLDRTLWQNFRFTAREVRKMLAGGALEVLLKHLLVTGATMAFASRLRPHVLPVGDGWVHDGWIATLIAAVAPCVPIAEPLISYRLHAEQQIGAPMVSLRRTWEAVKLIDRPVFAEQHAKFCTLRDHLARSAEIDTSRRSMALVQDKVAHCAARLRMRDGTRVRRIPIVAREVALRRYWRYGGDVFSVARDLFH